MGIAKIKKVVAQLSVNERAALAHWILTNLDAANNDQLDAAWRQEIRSRVEAIKAGKVQMIAAAEMWKELLSIYDKTS